MNIYCTRVLTLNLEGGQPFCNPYFEQLGPPIIPQTYHILFKSQDLCPSSSLHLECYFLPPLIFSLWQTSSYLRRLMSAVILFLWLSMTPSAPTPTPGRINCSLIWFPTHFTLMSGRTRNALHGHLRGPRVLIPWSDPGTECLFYIPAPLWVKYLTF